MQASAVYSFVLSQVFGLFLFIVGIALLSQSNHYRKVFDALKIDNPCIMLSTLLNLLIGLVLVYTHNVWVLKPIVYVTILSWTVFVNALLWLFLPKKMFRLSQVMMRGSGYYWFSLIALLIGLSILARGFWVLLFGGGDFIFLY